MPKDIMEGFLSRIPIYDAEDALINANVSMLPHMEKRDRRKVINTWLRIVNATRARIITDLEEFKRIIAGDNE